MKNTPPASPFDYRDYRRFLHDAMVGPRAHYRASGADLELSVREKAYLAALILQDMAKTDTQKDRCLARMSALKGGVKETGEGAFRVAERLSPENEDLIASKVREFRDYLAGLSDRRMATDRAAARAVV